MVQENQDVERALAVLKTDHGAAQDGMTASHAVKVLRANGWAPMRIKAMLAEQGWDEQEIGETVGWFRTPDGKYV